jgi:hypothetical protein
MHCGRGDDDIVAGADVYIPNLVIGAGLPDQSPCGRVEPLNFP